jgi:hypothetical protein
MLATQTTWRRSRRLQGDAWSGDGARAPVPGHPPSPQFQRLRYCSGSRLHGRQAALVFGHLRAPPPFLPQPDRLSCPQGQEHGPDLPDYSTRPCHNLPSRGEKR